MAKIPADWAATSSSTRHFIGNDFRGIIQNRQGACFEYSIAKTRVLQLISTYVVQHRTGRPGYPAVPRQPL